MKPVIRRSQTPLGSLEERFPQMGKSLHSNQRGREKEELRGMNSSFPRVLGKYVGEEGLLSIEKAVRRMSSAPASRIGLVDRGLIREGMIADTTVFNPATVKDKATFEKPH
jgi:N-acyl-D-aspartate/D-glutamate deacylase